MMHLTCATHGATCFVYEARMVGAAAAACKAKSAKVRRRGGEEVRRREGEEERRRGGEEERR